MNAAIATGTTAARIGRAASRITAGVILAVLLCGLAAGTAGAEGKNTYTHKNSVKISANEFADVCDQQGASDIEVSQNAFGSTVVTCSWGDDYEVSCNFTTKTCKDTFRVVPQESGIGGTTVGGDLAVAPEPSGEPSPGGVDGAAAVGDAQVVDEPATDGGQQPDGGAVAMPDASVGTETAAPEEVAVAQETPEAVVTDVTDGGASAAPAEGTQVVAVVDAATVAGGGLPVVDDQQ